MFQKLDEVKPVFLYIMLLLCIKQNIKNDINLLTVY